MTQAELNSQVARITGEPLSTILQLGFNIESEQYGDLEPEEVKLVLDCPFCGHPVPYPGCTGDGSEILAECDRCDIYFPFEISEVYTHPPDPCAGLAAKRAHRDGIFPFGEYHGI